MPNQEIGLVQMSTIRASRDLIRESWSRPETELRGIQAALYQAALFRLIADSSRKHRDKAA